MTNNNERRSYNLLDADLCMYVSNLCNYMTRDLTDLSIFGVTAAKITALKALGNTFEAFPTDGSFVGDVVVTTENKNMLREQLLAEIRNMVLRVEAKWGLNSGKLKRLDVVNPSLLSDELLLSAAKRVHLKMTDYLTDLADYGLTQAGLDSLAELTTQFELAKNAQAEASSLRDEKTEERIAMGNELYALVSMYCGFGKKVYEKTSKSKYKDYVIYGHAAGGLKPPVGLAYRPGDFVVSWGIVENATSYELQYSPDGSAWIEAYSGDADAVQYIPATEGWAYFRCRARNSNGYGAYSEVLKAGYYQQIPPPNNVKARIEDHTTNGLVLTWDEVPSATVYKIYTSIVPIGSPANNYEMFGKPKVNSFSAEVQTGKRYYFQLTAENQAQWSNRSTAIFIDVE